MCMAKDTKKSAKNNGFSGEKLRLIAYILLAASCVALFLIFGNSARSIPSGTTVSTPVPSPSAVPKGVPMGKFIEALKSSNMDCGFGEVLQRDDGRFVYPITLPDEREGAQLIVTTDSIGRVIESTLELSYVYAGEPDASFSEITASAIKAEYRRREKADTALIAAYFESIHAQLGEDCSITTIDAKKIEDSINTAYYSRKQYDKKVGGARFFCETETAEDNEFSYVFRLISTFNYSK